MTTSRSAPPPALVDAIRARQRFVISSHARPDGDSIGSQLAMAHALRQLGKEAHIVNRDPPPAPLAPFPGVAGIEIGDRVRGTFDAAIIMECGELARTGVSGLDQPLVINIDHHPGNTGYGHVNWFDEAAAACGEMVFDLVAALGARLSLEVATHVYVAILTDTGSFHYSAISPRTFDISRALLEAGVDPVLVARQVYDSNTMGKLKLTAAVISAMQVDATGRIAVLFLDDEIMRQAGGTSDDTDGLINMPLSVKEIEAVVFFRQAADGEYRVSMRSKGAVDIGSVAKQFGGGGHKNAAGCSAAGAIGALQERFVDLIGQAIDGRPASRR